MDGRPLFPERRAHTVEYEMSAAEEELYEAVTQCVREQMRRAEQLQQQGEGRRGTTVGFALTVPQRRLAWSPEAILRGLERRAARLERRRHELRYGGGLGEERPLRSQLDQLLGRGSDDDVADQVEELTGEEQEEIEEDVVDAATAAWTLAELDEEIATLHDLAELARRVQHSGTDEKWSELRAILDDNGLTRDADGVLRKIIVFTQHRHTLNYLVSQIRRCSGARRPWSRSTAGCAGRNGAPHSSGPPRTRTCGCSSRRTPPARA
jgi:hypothetical protein